MSRWRGTGPALGAVLVVALAGCRPASPRSAIEAYQTALRAGDGAALARHHARQRPRLRSAEQWASFQAAHPNLWAAAKARLDGRIEAVRLRAEVRLTSGATVALVRQDGRWLVEAGSVWMPAAETPEAALQTLADGVEHGDLAAVRLVMPEAAVARYATQPALERRVAQIRGRVARAMARIGPLRPGLAVVVGDRATITYEGQREVRFVWEAKRWRVLDVE